MKTARSIGFRAAVLSSLLAMTAAASNAFPVTDVMALPAAQVSANATTAAAAKITATASKNSEKEQATATKNSNEEIAKQITNTKNIMEQVHFFAKTPMEWVKTIREYANIGTGWPKPTTATPALTAEAIQSAITKALKDFDKEVPESTADLATKSDAYLESLNLRAEALGGRNTLVAEYEANNRSRAMRIKEMERMLNGADMQRQFDVVRTYLALEQIRFASEKASFDLSLKLMNEDAATKAQLAARNRVSDFTDLRQRKLKGEGPTHTDQGLRVDLPRAKVVALAIK